MKKLFGVEQLEEARSFASPVQNITSTNLLVDSCTAKYLIFEYPDAQHQADYAELAHLERKTDFFRDLTARIAAKNRKSRPNEKKNSQRTKKKQPRDSGFCSISVHRIFAEQQGL
jgi:hypothetical protein